MKNKVLFCVLVFILVSPFVFSASTDNLEYMVVSFGKGNFSQLKSKTMAYWDEGISKDAFGASSKELLETILCGINNHAWY